MARRVIADRPALAEKLGERFLEDLRDSWEERDAEALKACAEQDPTGYCKIADRPSADWRYQCGGVFYPDKSEYASGIRQSLPQSKCSSCCQQVTPFLRGIL